MSFSPRDVYSFHTNTGSSADFWTYAGPVYPYSASSTLQEAIDAGVRNISVPEPIMIDTPVDMPSDMSISGGGPNSKIYVNGDIYAFNVARKNRCYFSNLYFLKNDYVAGEGGAIYFYGEEKDQLTELTQWHDIDSCIFLNFGKRTGAIYGHNLLSTKIRNNFFFLNAFDICLEGQSIGVQIERNYADGRGMAGESTGAFLDCYHLRKDTGQRTYDFPVYNTAYNFNATNNPEGILLLANIIVGYDTGIILDGVYYARARDNIVDNTYRYGVLVRGCDYVDFSQNWIAINPIFSPPESKAFQAFWSVRNWIMDNKVTYIREGIELNNVVDSFLERNITSHVGTFPNVGGIIQTAVVNVTNVSNIVY